MTQIEIVEVGPRDGLQNESVLVSTADKIGLIQRSIDAGVRRIEVASFVNPLKVPQMADAEAVIAGLPDRPDVTVIGLVLNQRGADRALATRIDELGAVCVASETFAQRNQGQTRDGSVEIAREIVAMAKAGGRSAQITIGASFGCPFESEIDPDVVVAMAVRAAEAGPREIALADTIGVAVPAQVTRLVTRVREAIGPIPVRVHFHNTRGTGVANVWAAVQAGATVVDASLGGLGGCPFAPGASGNVATEDVIYMLNRSGTETGVSLDRLVASSGWLAGVMGKTLPSMVGRAPPFPATQQAQT
ncbi:MAG: hydroxymethylglutaryl-CoA lyase [Pseudomonadota bacterium]